MNYYANEVDGDALIQLAYEGLGNYLNKLPLSYKKKAAVLDAFNDIVNRGIVGFDKGLLMIQNSEGLDMSQYKGFNPYEEAAYYLEGVFKSTSTKPKEPEKPKDKFTNKEMLLDFANHMSKSRFGGASDLQSQWDSLDALDENGIRGTLNRKTELIKLLENWNPKFDNVDFTDSAFTDSNDFHARRQAAIDALKASEGISPQAVEALLRLGLNPGTLLRTGADEMVTYGDKQMTKLQAIEAMAKDKQAAEELKLATKKAEEEAALKNLRNISNNMQYDGYTAKKISSLDELGAKYGSEEALVNHILELLLKKLWNTDDIAEIAGYYKAKGGEDVDDDDLRVFLDHYHQIGFDENRFLTFKTNKIRHGLTGAKKLPGIEGIYFVPSTNKVIRYYNKNELQTGDLLAQYNPENVKAAAGLRKLSEGFLAEDYLRMGAIAQDILGTTAAYAPGYGTAASAVLGGTSLLTNMTADILDDSVSKWEVAKNAGINFGLGVVGLVPGLGTASKSGRWIALIAKWAPRLLTIQAIKDLPDTYKAIEKCIKTPSEITDDDMKAIAYGLSVIAGLSRGARGIYNNRKFSPAFTKNTEKQFTITTSKGKKTVNLKLVDEISKLNPKEKTYNEKVKEILKLKKDETVDTRDVKVLGKTLTSKGVKIKEESVSTGLSAKAKAYRDYLEKQNALTIANHSLLSRFLSTDYDIYKSNVSRNFPQFSSERLKGWWNPLSDKNLQKKGIVVNEQQSSQKNVSKTTGTLNNKTKSKSLSKEESKELKETFKGNKYSNNPLKSDEAFKIEGFGDVYGINNKNGTHTIIFETNGVKKEVTVSSENVKPETLKMLKETLRQLDRTLPRKLNSKVKLDLVKKLKQYGYLKHGGSFNYFSKYDY